MLFDMTTAAIYDYNYRPHENTSAQQKPLAMMALFNSLIAYSRKI